MANQYKPGFCSLKYSQQHCHLNILKYRQLFAKIKKKTKFTLYWEHKWTS